MSDTRLERIPAITPEESARMVAALEKSYKADESTRLRRLHLQGKTTDGLAALMEFANPPPPTPKPSTPVVVNGRRLNRAQRRALGIY